MRRAWRHIRSLDKTAQACLLAIAIGGTPYLIAAIYFAVVEMTK